MLQELLPSHVLHLLATCGLLIETLSTMSLKLQSKSKEKNMMTFWKKLKFLSVWRSTKELNWLMLSKKRGSKLATISFEKATRMANAFT
jgi:hypothetical protein